MSVNKVILVGNVGKDPETRYLDEGTAITKFPFATSETYRNRDGERVTTTEWHNVVLWRGLAQVAEKYVRKGSQLYLEGRIKTRSYDDADGNRKYITEIVGDQMQMLGRRADDQGSQDNQGYREGTGQSSGATYDQGSSRQTAGGQGQGSQSGQGQGSQSSPGAQSSPGSQSGQGQGSQSGQGQGGNESPDQDNTDDPFDPGEDGPDDLPF